jgi:hypothetical protein
VKRKKQRAGACPILDKVSTGAAAPKSILENKRTKTMISRIF